MIPLFLKVVWFTLFPTGGATGSSVFQSISPVHGQIVRLFPPLSPVIAAMIHDM